MNRQVAAVLVALSALTFTACTPAAPERTTPAVTQPAPAATHPAPATAPPALPAPTSAAPTFSVHGTAAANLAFFDYWNTTTITGGRTDGPAFIQALRAAGVPDTLMELTADTTPRDTQADTIQWSVRFADGCLLGDYGHGTYTSAVMPVLSYDTCLIGATRPLNF